MAGKVKIKFLRDTRKRESDVPHVTGDIISVSLESAHRWLRRSAAELFDPKAEAKAKADEKEKQEAEAETDAKENEGKDK